MIAFLKWENFHLMSDIYRESSTHNVSFRDPLIRNDIECRWCEIRQWMGILDHDSVSAINGIGWWDTWSLLSVWEHVSIGWNVSSHVRKADQAGRPDTQISQPPVIHRFLPIYTWLSDSCGHLNKTNAHVTR